jgi:uncharacterized protein DUF4403
VVREWRRAAAIIGIRANLRRCGRALAVACLLAGCGGPALSIPRPTDALAPPPPPPASEPSLLSFLVDVPLVRVREAAEAAFPPEVGREDSWVDAPLTVGSMGLQFQYRFWRDALGLEMGGDRLLARLDLRYRVRARLAGGPMPLEAQCGYDEETPRRLRIRASTGLGWNPSWGLRSATTFGAPEFLDSCRALPGGVDITPVLATLLQPGLETLAGTLDRRLGELATQRDRVAEVWRQLEVPVEVTRGAWLALRPRAVHAGPIVGAGPDVLRTVIQLTAEPVARLGAPPDAETRPLPDLTLAPAPARDFHVTLPLYVPFSVINERLAETVVGTSVDVGMSRPMSVTSVQAYGSGARLILALGVTGPATGVVYLAGTPAVDPGSQTLRVDGLAFTVDSDSALVRATGRFLHRRLVASLEPRARFRYADQLDGLRAQLGTALNRELVTGVELSGTVDRLDVQGVYPVPDGLELRTALGGSLRLIAR